MPPKWKLGDASSFAIDDKDNVWLLHRPRTLKPGDAAMAAPPVVVFDTAGAFVKAWGSEDAGLAVAQREHGIHVDAKGFVWITGNNCPTNGIAGLKPVNDDQILKLTGDGKLAMRIGESNASKGNADTRNVHRAADVWVHPAIERAVSSPMATAITASSSSMRTPARSSACGAPSATSPSTTTTVRW